MDVGVRLFGVCVRGPLAGHARGFADDLIGRGYTPGSTRLQLQLVAHLSRWLEVEELDASGLTELAAERFMAARRARGCRWFRSRQALEPLLVYLRGLGIAPAEATVAPVGPVEELLDRYRRYLLVERALTSGTARVYVEVVRPFVVARRLDDRLEWEAVTAADVSGFVLAEAARRPGTSIRSVATALRSLLGFLHVEGTLERSLTGAVPGVGAWRQAGLPRPLESRELARLMASCDRRRLVGRRDLAILLLLGRLGLRCGDPSSA